MMVSVAAAALPMPSARCPAPGGLGVLGEVADDAHAHLPGRLEAESRGRFGQGEVVVDGLGHMGDADAPLGAGMHLAAGIGGVVAADGHEARDVQFLQHIQDVLHRLRLLGGVGARGAQQRPALQVDGLDGVDGQVEDVLALAIGDPLERGHALDEVLEAVVEAQDLEALLDGLDGDGGDDAVEAGGRPAADEEGDAARMRRGHAGVVPWNRQGINVWTARGSGR